MDISATTRILGVIGHPVAHSYSPAMHNAAIADLGIDYGYVAFSVKPEEVEGAVRGIKALNIRGLNVTVPHKLAVIDYLDEISEEASVVGAVNTISFESDGRLIGYNTDVYGALTALSLSGGLDPLPPEVVVLGAGGAARAVVYGLGKSPDVERITILNRTVDRAENLADDIRKVTGKRMEGGPLSKQRNAFQNAGLVVNVTSLGMHPNIDSSPVDDVSVLHPGLTVFDTVFNPLETLLMRQAKSSGARALGGLDMLVFQGARSLEIWTGLKPSIEVMKSSVLKRFRS